MATDDAFARAVAEAAASGLWQPTGSTTTDTGHGLVVRYPPWAYTPLLLARFEPGADLDAALDHVVDTARREHPDVDELTCEVPLDPPAGFKDALVTRGARHVDTVDVLALDLTHDLPDRGPVDPRVEVTWVTDVAQARGFAECAVAGFGGAPSTEERLVTVAAESRASLAAGTGGRAVATLDGRVVAGGGLVLEDGVARLWGAAAVPEARGIGAYRAVLHHRLAFAREHGVPLALVKGRVATSGPILRRYGFTAYGQERTYQVPLGR